MANRLYSDLSEVCHTFYRMYFPHEDIAEIIDAKLRKYGCREIVFFGGLLNAAKILNEKGYRITFVEYTEEMMNEAKRTIDCADFIVSDMRRLKLDEKKDAIVLMGRIMTYMHTDKDVIRALKAFSNNLKAGGIVVMDNYETGIIDKGEYFNGTIELKDGDHTLRRISKIIREKECPALYRWDCVYEDIDREKRKTFTDNGHILRAFTKDEIRALIEKAAAGMSFIEHSENFEKRSFVTVAQKRDINLDGSKKNRGL